MPMAIFVATAAQSQIINTTPYEFAVGLSGGTTLSSVTFNPKVTQGVLQGITFGATGRLTMGENVGLQAELNYVQQGWKETYDDFPDLNYSRILNYLQLPFYTHAQFGGKSVKGFIQAGPQIGYLLGEATRENLNGEQPGRVNYQHDMPVEKRFEWGLSGGVGIEIRTGAGYFILEGRYYYAFSDIYSTRRKDNFVKASDQTVTVKLSYLIPFRQ